MKGKESDTRMITEQIIVKRIIWLIGILFTQNGLLIGYVAQYLYLKNDIYNWPLIGFLISHQAIWVLVFIFAHRFLKEKLVNVGGQEFMDSTFTTSQNLHKMSPTQTDT